MFGGASNVKLGGELPKTYYPNISVMRGVEHNVSLFFNDFSKIPVMNHMITAHKAIYNVFVSDKYYKHHYILKSKLYAFQDHNVGLFSGDYTSMAGYLIGMHIDMCMRKSLLATISSGKFNTMSLNSKLSKVVSYVQDGRGYILESLTSLVRSLWQKRQLHIDHDFAVTVWMLYVIPHICKDAKYH